MIPSTLPPPPERERPPTLVVALNTLDEIYQQALQVLDQDHTDLSQVKFHVDVIEDVALPLLVAIEQEYASTDLEGWLMIAATQFGDLFRELSRYCDDLQNEEDENVYIPQPVTVVHSGRRGRPRKVIDLAFLNEAFSSSRNISVAELSRVLGIHQNTLRAYMKKHGIRRSYSTLSNAELDDIVLQYKTRCPEAGLRFVVGHLRVQGHRLQYRRVLGSIRRVDRTGQVLRNGRTRRRPKYDVTRSNALWHMDGHHKLIRWGIVIHGIVDGFCRTITALQANDNNHSGTVLDLFKSAESEYGMPSRVRGDRGVENMDAATYVITKNGTNRASFLWGSSTHNSRIERLWVEFGARIVRRWRAFFTRLENHHRLDPEDPHHLWALHVLFLPAINEDCRSFQLEWNRHPIEGVDKSPMDLRFLGQTQSGVHQDDCDGVRLDIINKYYGVHGEPITRKRHQSGAGHPADSDSDEESEDDDNTDDELTAQDANEDALFVPSHESPFTNPEDEAIFFEMLKEINDLGFIPNGFGLKPDEWEEGSYPAFETIQLGRRGSTHLDVSLVDEVWYERACLWCHAFVCLTHLMGQSVTATEE